jgi:hypothetical protein
MTTAILTFNALFALLSGVSALIGALRPGIVAPAGEPVTSTVRLFAEGYAWRAVPLSAVALTLMATQARSTGLIGVLVVLGVAQFGDSLLGVRRKIWGMTATAGAGALLHLASAVYLAVALA